MDKELLQAHSLAEAKLYLLAHACPRCRCGPVTAERGIDVQPSAPLSAVTLSASCGTCGHEFAQSFKVAGSFEDHVERVINPTDHPSRMLDVAQWVMLSTMLVESSRTEPNRVRMRQLRIQARLCLDEALKFYVDEENDLPPSEALFTKSGREQFKSNPAGFSRQRLLAMRQSLPTSLS